MCTSASTACWAASIGVLNSGPMSTTNPRSAKAEAMTFWPRSWPSWPILASRMRGRRPSASSKASTLARTLSTLSFSAPISLRYTPEIDRISAR